MYDNEPNTQTKEETFLTVENVKSKGINIRYFIDALEEKYGIIGLRVNQIEEISESGMDEFVNTDIAKFIEDDGVGIFNALEQRKDLDDETRANIRIFLYNIMTAIRSYNNIKEYENKIKEYENKIKELDLELPLTYNESKINNNEDEDVYDKLERFSEQYGIPRFTDGPINLSNNNSTLNSLNLERFLDNGGDKELKKILDDKFFSNGTEKKIYDFLQFIGILKLTSYERKLANLLIENKGYDLLIIDISKKVEKKVDKFSVDDDLTIKGLENASISNTEYFIKQLQEKYFIPFIDNDFETKIDENSNENEPKVKEFIENEGVEILNKILERKEVLDIDIQKNIERFLAKYQIQALSYEQIDKYESLITDNNIELPKKYPDKITDNLLKKLKKNNNEDEYLYNSEIDDFYENIDNTDLLYHIKSFDEILIQLSKIYGIPKVNIGATDVEFLIVQYTDFFNDKAKLELFFKEGGDLLLKKILNEANIDDYETYKNETKNSDELRTFIDQLEIMKLHSYEHKLAEKLINKAV